MTHTVTVDVVSDVMCPWCFIGKRRLETALAQTPDVPASVHWRPFQLDPTIPAEGMDRQAYLTRKFGDEERIAATYSRIAAAGQAEGIAFAFERIERSPNTIEAHKLIRWAGTAGVQDTVVERLFALYFVEGANLNDRSVLLQVAEDAGMDGRAVGELLEEDADRDRVEREIALAQKLGVSGVPAFILDNRYIVMGAQDPGVLAAAIAKTHAEPLPDAAE